MKLSLIIPVYNAPDDLRICLESVRRSLSAEPCDLILINDCSAPETTDLLRHFVRHCASDPLPLQVRLVEHERNRGYLETVNEGLALAEGDIVVLLNSDTAIPTDFAPRVLACFADPAVGVASPIGSHCGLFSIPMKPGLGGTDVDRMDAYFRPWPAEYPTVILPDGFCFCLRKAVTTQIGFFDPRYSPGYFEETDWGMRARQAGWKTVLIDNLYVYHRAQASFGSAKNQELVRRNERLFHQLWGEEYAQLRTLHPREAHKARLYARAYSTPERIWRKTVRFLASFIPVPTMRRRIRRAYN